MPEIDYQVNVGKTFRGKEGTDFVRDAEYKVIELLPRFNFGTNGGWKAAYRFERVGHGQVTIHPCEKFIEKFEEVVVPAEAAPAPAAAQS